MAARCELRKSRSLGGETRRRSYSASRSASSRMMLDRLGAVDAAANASEAFHRLALDLAPESRRSRLGVRVDVLGCAFGCRIAAPDRASEFGQVRLLARSSLAPAGRRPDADPPYCGRASIMALDLVSTIFSAAEAISLTSTLIRRDLIRRGWTVSDLASTPSDPRTARVVGTRGGHRRSSGSRPRRSATTSFDRHIVSGGRG